jgi:hypothetical protein
VRWAAQIIIIIMSSLNTYTQNIPLTQKAKFWSNYVSALKGNFKAAENHRTIQKVAELC